MLKIILFRGLLFFLSVLSVSACSPYFHQPLSSDRSAQLGPETPMKKELLSLPKPKEPVVVAVYKFRDQTGQYKASNLGTSWSTAVTQGATNILIRALEESGWFVPIERENISNLFNERKIIRSSREQYEGAGGSLLPPLLFAGVLLEGGIVSYETNIYTGGAGLRYFGSDASAQYREDRVSVYLRAISTSNGKILKTIYTTKSILSQEVSVGVFRYVKFKHLLEAETGYTYNEPTELAVTEAIEKAVQGLVIEGLLDKLWFVENAADLNCEVIKQYEEEKEEQLKFDPIGQSYSAPQRPQTYFTALASTQFYAGDYSVSYPRLGATASFGLGFTKFLFLETSLGCQQVQVENLMSSNEFFTEMNLTFLTNPKGKFSPFLSIGGGTYFDYRDRVGLSDKKYAPYISYSGGLEYIIADNVAITTKAFANQLFTDYYDGQKAGTLNDHIWGFKLGIKLYLGKK